MILNKDPDSSPEEELVKEVLEIIFAFGSKSEIGSRDVSRFFSNKLIG